MSLASHKSPYHVSSIHRHTDPRRNKSHHINSSPIFLTLNAQSWLPRATKARLLEWKIRMDLLQYAARAVPPLLPVESITAYKTSRIAPNSTPIPELIARLHSLPDDGHAIKLARAAAICRQLTAPYAAEGKPWVQFKGDETWDAVLRIVVESVESQGPTWVRTTGLDEAWDVSLILSLILLKWVWS